MSALILDAGALVAVDRDDRTMMARLRAAQQHGLELRTSVMVIARVWRDRHGRQASLARLLQAVDVRAVSQRDGRDAGVLQAAYSDSDPNEPSAARACVHVSARSDMRYTGSVSNAFVQSMAHNFEQALRLMDAALTDCPDDLWQTDLWPDEAPTAPAPHGGLHGSAPWFLGYHALLTLDYDLAAEFEPWAPPQPFDDNTFAFPNRRFTKPELLGYVDWCRGRVRQTLDGLTEEMAARPLPSAHRYHGMLFAVIVGSMPLHVVEHASQIRQFLTAAGVTVQPMPGDRGYTG